MVAIRSDRITLTLAVELLATNSARRPVSANPLFRRVLLSRANLSFISLTDQGILTFGDNCFGKTIFHATLFLIDQMRRREGGGRGRLGPGEAIQGRSRDSARRGRAPPDERRRLSSLTRRRGEGDHATPGFVPGLDPGDGGGGAGRKSDALA